MFYNKRDAKYGDARERSDRERVQNDGSVSFFVIDFFLPLSEPILPFVVQVRSAGPYSSTLSFSKPAAQSPPKGSHSGSCKSHLRFHPSPAPSLPPPSTSTHLHHPSKNTPPTNTPNSLPCRFLWGIALLPLGVYVIAQDLNVPLIVQPQLLSLFSLLS